MATRALALAIALGATAVVACEDTHQIGADAGCAVGDAADLGDPFMTSAAAMLADGRHTFRYETFGDEAFWGDTLGLHKAIAGAANELVVALLPFVERLPRNAEMAAGLTNTARTRSRQLHQLRPKPHQPRLFCFGHEVSTLRKERRFVTSDLRLHNQTSPLR